MIRAISLHCNNVDGDLRRAYAISLVCIFTFYRVAAGRLRVLTYLSYCVVALDHNRWNSNYVAVITSYIVYVGETISTFAPFSHSNGESHFVILFQVAPS